LAEFGEQRSGAGDVALRHPKRGNMRVGNGEELRVVLGALADAATGHDLVSALHQAAERLPGPDSDLATLAASFAALARRGAAERQLAIAVLRDVGDYAERRPPRPR
jgi:hypothetical protein